MNQETRPTGRRRVLAAAAVLAAVVGGGYVAVGPAAADPCDVEDVFFCAEEPDSEGALLDLMPEEAQYTPEPIEEDEPVDDGGEPLLPEDESAPEETDSNPAQSYTEEDLQKFKQGYDGAHARLAKSDKKCLNLISRGVKLDGKGAIQVDPELGAALTAGQPNAREVLDAVFRAGNIKLFPMGDSARITGTGKTAPAFSKFRGKSGQIALFREYFGSEPAARHTYLNPPEADPLSDPEGRILIMLHELAHLMRTLPGNEDFEFSIKNLVHPFNAQIVRDCVKNV